MPYAARVEAARDGEAEPGLQAICLTVRDSRGGTRVDDISFSLPGRSLLAAVGPSGAGKSTLLGALSGMRPAQSGHVCFGGRDLYAQYRAMRHQVGYVLQEDVVHSQLTVQSALGYAGELRFAPDVPRVARRRRVEEVIAELGLAGCAHRRIRTLSGGQRRRVNIGVELLTRPRLLFLDEPTSGLDPGMERQVMHLLRDLADGGRTVVLVTHSVLCLDVCDQVMFVAPGGRMAYFGPPAEALPYFGCADYAEVFSTLDERRDVDWKGAFRASPAYRRHAEQPPAAVSAPARPPRAPRTRGRLPQLWILVHRYLAVLGSDRLNLALLLLQAPILAAIVAQAVAPGGFVEMSKDAYPAASQALLFLVVAASYLGAGNAVREIVKELPIYLRERATGLSIVSYLGSKVLVLAVVTAVQAALLVVIGAYRQGGPGQGAVMPLRPELVVDLAAAGIVSMGAGLLISALVSRADKALTLLPLLLVPQLVLTVPGLEIEQKPVLNQLSFVASARWGYDALGSSVHMNQLLYQNEASVDPLLAAQDSLWEVADIDAASPAQWADIAAAGTGPEARWRRQPGAWAGDLGALAVLFLVELAATAWALRRRDPGR
jgi:ABC-type multidrug transport system ATPase subunit